MDKITKDMKIFDVLKLSEDTAPVFFGYGMHCLGCPVAKGETVEEAAAAHGIDCDALIKSLNEVVG